MQVRWDQTHGYQRDQPSWLTGSGSSDRRDQGKKHEADVKKLLPTLDIGSHINAGRQLLPEAGATQERTLEAVSCSPMLDAGIRYRLLATQICSPP